MNTIQIRHRKNLVDFYNADLSIGVALDAGNLDGAADLIEEITDLLVGPARDLVKLRHSLRENGHTNGVESLTGLVQAYAEALETFERRVVAFGKLRRATPKTEATGPGLVKDADGVNTLTHITLMDGTRIRTYTLLLPCTEATALLKDIMGDQGSLTGLEIEARLMDHEATLRPADAKPAGKQARLVVDVQRWSIWRSKLDDVDKLR